MLRITLNLSGPPFLDSDQHAASVMTVVRTRGMDNLIHDSFDYTVVPERRAGRRRLRYVPVPVSSMTCGLVEALSMMVTVPSFAPFFVGENVALMVQVAPSATLAP